MVMLHDVVSNDSSELSGITQTSLTSDFLEKDTIQINPNCNVVFTLSDSMRDSSLSTATSYCLPKYHCEHRKEPNLPALAGNIIM